MGRERKIEIIGTYFINEPLYNLNVKEDLFQILNVKAIRILLL